MSKKWIHESPARWDRNKASVLGSAPPGVFDFAGSVEGSLLPGDWWRVEDQGKVAGYAWMDSTWGDAEVLLCVERSVSGRGIGSFIMDRLEDEARLRGLNHLYNVVPAKHPEPERLRCWLEKRHFVASEDGKVLRRVVSAE
ncbi:MAG: GNAT family N-acetyltransferase [Polyangiaceae bacterium]